MSNPFALLPPPVCVEEARDFTDHKSGAVFPLAFRVIPGPIHDTRLSDLEDRLKRRFVDGPELVSLPAQPPQKLGETMCEYLALLMACQVPPKEETTVQGGIQQDATGLGWKPWTLDMWVDLANRAEEVFYACLAFVRVLDARAEGLKPPRYQVAVAYQTEAPEELDPQTRVTPDLSGLLEPDPAPPTGPAPLVPDLTEDETDSGNA